MGSIIGGGSNSGLKEAKAAQKEAERRAKELEAERQAKKEAERTQIEEEAVARLDAMRSLMSGKRGSKSLLGPGGSAKGYSTTVG